jgi:antitoxin component YwqK of YwqJK toxin-antitoxin module
MNRMLVWAVLAIAGCGEQGDLEQVVTAKWPSGAVKREADVVSGDTLAVRVYHENGQVDRVEAYDTEGRKSGIWQAFYPDGKPWSEHHYREGVQIGAYRTFHPNGALYIDGSYGEDGTPSGTWRFYSADSTLLRTIDGAAIAGGQAGRTTNPH